MIVFENIAWSFWNCRLTANCRWLIFRLMNAFVHSQCTLNSNLFSSSLWQIVLL